MVLTLLGAKGHRSLTEPADRVERGYNNEQYEEVVVEEVEKEEEVEEEKNNQR